MPATVGYALRAGLAREATTTSVVWPAASAALVTRLLPLLTWDANDGANKAGAPSLASSLGPLAFDLLSLAPTLTVPLQARYEGLEQLWALACGFGPRRYGATLNPETLATGAYRHRYELEAEAGSTPWMLGEGWQLGDTLQLGQRKTKRATVAADLQAEVWELLSSMVNGWSLTMDQGNVTWTLDLLSHSKSASSSVNTATTLGNALPSVAPRLLPSQAVFRIAPYSGSTALNSGDAVQVSSWALRVEHNLTASFGPRLGTAPEEFARQDLPRVTLTFVLPRHSAETWQSRWRANSRVMADCKWTGGQIAATGINYQCNVYLPSMQVTNAQLSSGGAALVNDTVQCVGVIPTAAAAGFPTMHTLGPLMVELVSAISTHGLL